MKPQIALACLGLAFAPLVASAQESTGEVLPVTTESEIEELIGAPLLPVEDKYERTKAAEYDIGQPEDVFVIDSGVMKSSAAWTAEDSAACKASGGIELPISAGRIACFKL